MIRIFDFLFSLIGIIILFPVMLFLYVLGLFDTGSPLFFQHRMGKNKKTFTLVKFRTMHKDSVSKATHLMSKSSVTPLGGFMRKTKLDELPQLFNVVLGDMSLVGPRPNLLNQDELISFREKLNVYSVRPGITGLAQINEIDMSTPELLAETDAKMINTLDFGMYISLIIQTGFGKGSGDRLNKNN
jgi:lipopolysaccharide/colanic/teichoic acid biosynthesis glycosyltransferase